MDDTVAAQMARRHIPGLSLAVIEKGMISRAQGYGVTDLAVRTPVTPQTLFQAGSISKPVSALGALALVEHGSLALDADINSYLKSWRVPENDFTREQKVTLRRLLSHSAGVTVHGFGGYAAAEPIPTLRQVLDGEAPANSHPIRVDLIPGTQERYSGGGYVIVQQAVLDVTGQAFPEYMRSHVLEALGMSASTFEQPLPPARQPWAAHGYYRGQKAVEGGWHVYPEMAPAGLWTTPSDLARFAIALQDSLAGRRSPVISQTMTRTMLTAQIGNTGLGLGFAGRGPSRRFQHSGRDEGFDALLIAYCETGQGAVVMINANDDSSAVAQIIDAVATAYHWPDYPRHVVLQAVPDRTPELTGQIKAWFERTPTAPSLDVSLFTAELGVDLASDFSPGSEGRQELASFGSLQAIELVTDNAATRVRKYRVIFARETIVVRCGFDPAGKIAAFNYVPE